MTFIKTKLNDFYRVLIRILTFTAKELRNIFHQPRLIFSLILGPFLILLIFGLGHSQAARVLDTLFVVPEDSAVAQNLQLNIESLPTNLNYVGMTPDADAADARLRRGEVDLVIVTPVDPATDWEQNSQARFVVYHNEIDPIEATYVQIVAQRSVDALNQVVLREVADQAKEEAQVYQQDTQAARDQAAVVRQSLEQNNTAAAKEAVSSLQENVDLLSVLTGSGLLLLSNLEPATGESDQTAVSPLLSRLETIQQDLDRLSQMDTSQSDLSDEIALATKVETDLTTLDNLLTQFQQTDSRILVEPFTNETLSITEANIDPTQFYVPAVLSLLLQHIAITMAGLSIVRERREGALELFRAAPVSSFETLLGKYLGFLLLTGFLAAVLTGLIVWGLGTPMLGTWEQFALTMFALLLASLGVGFHISLSAQTDSQAIQYSMIMLLASIFFTGFFLPLYRLLLIADIVSWMLPATYSTVLLKDIMLRGQTGSILVQGILLLASLLLFLLAWWRLYRYMRQE